MQNLGKKALGMNILCAVLMLGLLVCQFLPFWNGCSIQEYVWIPEDNKDVGTFLQERVGAEFAVGDVVAMPLLVLISGAAGVLLTLRSEPKMWTGIAGAVCGVSALCGYLSEQAFRTGSLWVVHLLLAIGILVSAVSAILANIKLARSEE